MANEIIDFDVLTDQTLLGYIYGRLAAAGPHAGFTGTTIATNQIFEVRYVSVSEPSTTVLLGLARVCLLGLIDRSFRRLI